MSQENNKYPSVWNESFRAMSIDELIKESILIAQELKANINTRFDNPTRWTNSIRVEFKSEHSRLIKQLIAYPFEVHGELQMRALYSELMIEFLARKAKANESSLG